MPWIQWFKNIDLARKDISKKLVTFGSDRKKMAEFRCSAEKGHALKESGVTTQREVEVGILLLVNDKNVTVDKVLSYF